MPCLDTCGDLINCRDLITVDESHDYDLYG